EAPRQFAGLRLEQPTQREAQEVEFGAARRKQEIALVAAPIAGPVQLGSVRSDDAAHIMAGGEGRGAEIARCRQEIAKLDPLIAAYARDRRFAATIGDGEIVDHLPLEAALIVKNVVRNVETFGDAPRIGDVLAGAARTLTPDGDAVVVKLQRNAHDLETALDQEGGGDRRIDPARHRDDDATVGRVSGKIKL